MELPEAEECCGFGGTFAVKNADVSAAMLEAKLDNVLDTGADVVCACDSSRLLHIGGGLRRRGRQFARSTSPRCSPREPGRANGTCRAVPARGAGGLANTTGPSQRPTRDSNDPVEAAQAVNEVPDWEELRDAGAALKDVALLSLDRLLVDLEAAVVRRGGSVHWARDAAEANALVTELVQREGVDSVVKVKSLATEEIGLNEALAAVGVHAIETDLAELIVQLAGERPSHLLFPAITRTETRSATSSASASSSLSWATRLASSRRRRAGSCARRSSALASQSRARTSPAPTPEASWWSNPRETAACARRCRTC